MTTKAGMLPGDEFTLQEWEAAKGQPSTAPKEVPAEVAAAYKTLLHACQRHGVPMVTMFALADGIQTRYDLLDKPANVPEDFLQARAQASGDLHHQLGLMALALQKMDLSKLKGL